MAEQKLFTVRLYEGGLTSANQTAVTLQIKAENSEDAFQCAMDEYPGSIVIEIGEQDDSSDNSRASGISE